MGEPCPAYTDELGVFHSADGRAWGEGARHTFTDYRPFPDAHTPNCGECVPCLKELLHSARQWADRLAAAESEWRIELIRVRGELAALADRLRAIADRVGV